MKAALLIIFCALTLTTSAQFWKKKVPKPVIEAIVVRYPDAEQPIYSSDISIPYAITSPPDVYPVSLKRSTYNIELAEDEVMKQAKHNMRYREYKSASYNFSDLANLYILQNRFSEAKWYLLQSLAISREQNDDRHTLANLLDMAAIKIAIGELILAKADLQEAHDLALAKGLTTDVTAIETRMHDMETNAVVTTKVTLRYAQSVEANTKSHK